VIALWLILYQQAENNIITPKIFKRTVDLHPFASVVAVTLFGMVFGIIGTLLAIPVVKAAQIMFAAVRDGRRGAEESRV
jgi:predicted PurR-regulated permease PerM